MGAGPGYADSPSRALHAAPPDEVLRWVERALDGSIVQTVTPQLGGTSAAMHRVTVVDRAGPEFEVMLRRYVDLALTDDPSPARREADVLEHMASSAVPTPVVLAVDADGSEVGAPALLMTVLEGRPRWDAKGRRHWAHDLAELAAAIHEHRPDDTTAFRSFALYQQESYEPPRWASDVAIWERAVTIFHGPVPTGTAFVHRDFHPGNLLWQRRRVTGVVDWESSCIGPADIDVGHCRVNFLYETPELAAHLADAWLDVTGDSYNPWADIATIVGLLDSLRAYPPTPSARLRLETALADAAAILGV